jgi:nucleotide-binding universal stress UspA family protein
VPGDEGLSPAVRDALFEAAERSGRELTEKVLGQFKAWCSANGVVSQTHGNSVLSADFTDVIGYEERILVHEARLADITVMVRLADDGADESIFLTALLEGGHPVMLVPASLNSKTASNVVVAWNDSPEASRAIAAAMPLLTAASQVTVFTGEDTFRADVQADHLIDYLLAHDIRARVVQPNVRSNEPVEDQLILALHSTKADLLIMGAYTHSRLKEWLFGGVTRRMLHDSPVPVIMSH